MPVVLRIIDRLSATLDHLGRFAIFVLIISMMYEVVARYAFGAPTLWAFDVSYMLNGSIFLLGAAYALREDAHIRIDFLSQKMPRRVQQLWNAGVYFFVMAPITGSLAWVATRKAAKAFVTGEVESVSPWAPVVWPFYSIIALGLAMFSLQFVGEAIKFATNQKTPSQDNDEDNMTEIQE